MRGMSSLKEQLCIKSQKVPVIFNISKKKSAMLFLHQTVVLVLFLFLAFRSLHIQISKGPITRKLQQFLSSQFLLFSVFGSNSLSDRNVPAGDDFVKIHVNSFPVLTQTGVKKKNLSHKDVHVKNKWVGKYMNLYSFVLSRNTFCRKSSQRLMKCFAFTWVYPRWVCSLSFHTSLDVCSPKRILKCPRGPPDPPSPSLGRSRRSAPCATP